MSKALPSRESREALLWEALCRACARLGGEVRRFAEAENLVRAREGNEDPGPSHVLEVQGVPNLLHEVLHIVQVGEILPDHGTEYGQIPFDPASASGRRLLFEELACCIVSARWHPGDEPAARAWYEEQVGIQGLFFGQEPEAFPRQIEPLVRAQRTEFEHTLESAEHKLCRLLREANAEQTLLAPHHPLSYRELLESPRKKE